MVTGTLERRTAREVEQREPTRVPRFRPDVDILETPDELRLVADLPGAAPDEIDVRFENGTLTLYAGTGAARSGDGDRGYLLREYGVGDYYRAFEIGQDIDAQRITADYEHGVLTLHLPKAEGARARKIEVRAQ